MNYYFLASYLPELHRDDIKIRVSLTDLLEERFHIPEEDWKEIELVLLGRDVLIVERLLSGKTIDLEHSLFGPEFWRDQIKSPKEGPEFLQEFLRSSDLHGFGPRDVDKLYGAYFDHVLSSTSSPFLLGYFSFHRDLRNMTAALRAKRKGVEVLGNLVGEGELVDLLTGSTAEDFGLGREYPWFENLIEAEAPHQSQDVIDQVLWDYLDENAGPDPFGFNVILGCLLKIEMLHKRLALSEEDGVERVRRLGGL